MSLSMIFFDLDNTLLDEEAARNKHLPEFYNRYKHRGTSDFPTFTRRWAESLEIYYKMFLDGKLTIEEQRLRRIEHSLGTTSISLAELEEMGRDYTRLNEESWMVFPEWKPFLDRSPPKKSLVTNGSSVQQRKKLYLLDLEKYFTKLFISEEVGFAKPSKSLFEMLFSESEFHPRDCVFVGDNLNNDILPSIDIGMKAIWINHFGKATMINDTNLLEVKTVHAAVRELERLEI